MNAQPEPAPTKPVARLEQKKVKIRRTKEEQAAKDAKEAARPIYGNTSVNGKTGTLRLRPVEERLQIASPRARTEEEKAARRRRKKARKGLNRGVRCSPGTRAGR